MGVVRSRVVVSNFPLGYFPVLIDSAVRASWLFMSAATIVLKIKTMLQSIRVPNSSVDPKTSVDVRYHPFGGTRMRITTKPTMRLIGLWLACSVCGFAYAATEVADANSSDVVVPSEPAPPDQPAVKLRSGIAPPPRPALMAPSRGGASSSMAPLERNDTSEKLNPPKSKQEQ